MYINDIYDFIQLRQYLIVGLFLLLISACDNPNDLTTSQKESINLTHSVRLGISHTPPSWLTHIAEHNGYFKEQGLNVIYTSFPSGKRALNGMFRGEVDIAVTAEGPIVFNSLERQDFSIIATIGTSSNDNVIAARKDRGIQTPNDLKGKTVAIQSASAAHFYLHLFLLKYKLSEKDIIQSFLKVEHLPLALASGEADAISTREPYLSEAVTMLGANAIVFETPGLYLKSYELAAFNTYIKDNPEVLYKLINALLLAEQFVKNNKDQAVAIFASKFGLSKERVTATLKYLDLSVVLDQSLILKLEDEARWATQNKLTDGQVVPNYLEYIHIDALNKTNPELMTIVGID